jgi:hypothetical protein
MAILSETYYIDGQALTPTDFGEFDAKTQEYGSLSLMTGTYGTNGFYP